MERTALRLVRSRDSNIHCENAEDPTFPLLVVFHGNLIARCLICELTSHSDRSTRRSGARRLVEQDTFNRRRHHESEVAVGSSLSSADAPDWGAPARPER